MKKIAYPGTFNPFHNGHLDVVNKLNQMFDEVHILVMKNSNKNLNISEKIRAENISLIFKEQKNIFVHYSNISLEDTLIEKKLNLIARGIRNNLDANIEIQRAIMLKKIANVETIIIPTSTNTAFISSTIIRELIALNKDISDFVPKQISNQYKIK